MPDTGRSGDSPRSAVAEAITPPNMPVTPVLDATANGENAIDLAWTEPDNRSGAITGYELQVSTYRPVTWAIRRFGRSVRCTTFAMTPA